MPSLWRVATALLSANELSICFVESSLIRMYLADTIKHLVFHTHMDAWRQTDSPVWAGEGDAVRRDGGRAGIDSKTFLCPQLQDRAAIRYQEKDTMLQIHLCFENWLKIVSNFD